MVTAVEAAKQGYASQKDFERLYNYYLARRIKIRMMSWRQQSRMVSLQPKPIMQTDGDLYIAYVDSSS